MALMLLETMMSNEDQTVSTEGNSDTNAIDSSKAREFPDVRFDNVLSKENLEETIRLSRESPKVLSDNVSERMVEKRGCNMQSRARSRCFRFLSNAEVY